MQVAVCGPAECTDDEARAAFEVGRLLARRGAIVLCGGGPGVMAAAAAGARSAGGIAVGVRPGQREPGAAAVELSVVINSGLGQARNAVLISSADAVIAVGGSWGTLSEVALAMRRARDLVPGSLPVVNLGGWRVVDAAGLPVPGVLDAATPAEAVELALTAPS
jgi:uncharacterized protein (TIGR00725 family)